MNPWERSSIPSMDPNDLRMALSKAQLRELLRKLPKPIVPKDQLEAGYLLGIQYVRDLLQEYIKE